MTAIDMSTLKIYNNMHPANFFFFTSKKIETSYCEIFRVFSKDHLYQSQMFFQSLLRIH